MRAVPVDNKSRLKAFHLLPRKIYANDPNYIPHIKQDIDKIFDPSKNKLFKEGKAQRWIFYKDDELVGRVAAFINAKTAYTEDQPTGGMGFFEVVDEQAVANFILDTARNWLRDAGMEAMDGPINFGERNQFWGCLTENFTDPNSYAMNYNPPYYPQLLETYGFQTYFEQYLYTRPVYIPTQEVFAKKFERLLKNENITVSSVVNKSLDEVAKDFRTVYNAAWGGHDNFKEMTAEAAAKIMKSLKPVIDKRIIIFAYQNEIPIAFFVNIPELNEIFKYVDGNLNWMGKLKFLFHKWKGTPQTMVGIVFGVDKAWHGRGVDGALIHWSGLYLTEKKLYDQIVMTWVGDFNPKMIKVCENLQATRYRTMITYRYLFDRNAPFKRCPAIE